MMRKVFLALTILALAPTASAVEFGWHPASHGTYSDLGGLSLVNVGFVNKGLVYWASNGDVLDSIKFWGISNDGSAESCNVYIYALTSDLGTIANQVYDGKMGPITMTAGVVGLDLDYVFPYKGYFAIVLDTLTGSGGGFYGTYRTTTGTSQVMVPAENGEDLEYKTAPAQDPWGTEGTNVASFQEVWGVVVPAHVATGANAVTYVSDWDSSSGTGTSTSWIMSNPGSLQNLDVMIAAFVKGDDLAGSSVSEPSGWRVLTEASSTGEDDQQIGIYYKIVTDAGSEPSTYTWTLGAAETRAGGIVAFRNVDTISIMDCSPYANYILNHTNTDPICRSITTRTDSAMVFVFATASRTDTGTVTTPTGTTNLWARKAGNATTAWNACFAAYDLKEKAGATGNYAWTTTDVSATDGHTFTLALRPRGGMLPDWGGKATYQHPDSMRVTHVRSSDVANNYGAYTWTASAPGAAAQTRNMFYKPVADHRTGGYIQDSCKLHFYNDPNNSTPFADGADTAYMTLFILKRAWGEGTKTGATAGTGECNWTYADSAAVAWSTAGALGANDRYGPLDSFAVCKAWTDVSGDSEMVTLTIRGAGAVDSFFTYGAWVGYTSGISSPPSTTWFFFSDDHATANHVRPWIEGWEHAAATTTGPRRRAMLGEKR